MNFPIETAAAFPSAGPLEPPHSRISELQQQAYAQGLELQYARHGYVESRREQVCLHEELSMKEVFWLTSVCFSDHSAETQAGGIHG